MNIVKEYNGDEVQTILKYTWEEFDRDVELFCQSIMNNFDFWTDAGTCMVTFPKGGLPVSTKMSHCFLENIPVFIYDGKCKKFNYNKHEAELLDNQTIIIVDDILDSGQSIENYMSLYKDILKDKLVIVYTIFAKTEGLVGIEDRGQRMVYSHLAPDRAWVEFPWERFNYEVPEDITIVEERF